MPRRHACRILADMKKQSPISLIQVRLWRRRVAEIRRVAANLNPGFAKDMMLSAAKDYELVANEMERRLQPEPEPAPSKARSLA
jgi:hypothetical protein